MTKVGEPLEESTPSLGDEDTRPPRRRLWIWLTLGAVVVVLLAVAFGLGRMTSSNTKTATKADVKATATTIPAPSNTTTPNASVPSTTTETAGSFTGSCTTGSYVTGDATGPNPGYQLTLDNTSGETQDVLGYVVIFYDGTGAETGSDAEGGGSITATYLAAGQSLDWLITPDNGASGGDETLSGNVGASCQLSQVTTSQGVVNVP
jgi:hypothetical protein